MSSERYDLIDFGIKSRFQKNDDATGNKRLHTRRTMKRLPPAARAILTNRWSNERESHTVL